MLYISKKQFEEYKKKINQLEKETIKEVLWKIIEDCGFSPSEIGFMILKLYAKLKEEDSNKEENNAVYRY